MPPRQKPRYAADVVDFQYWERNLISDITIVTLFGLFVNSQLKIILGLRGLLLLLHILPPLQKIDGFNRLNVAKPVILQGIQQMMVMQEYRDL